MKHIYTITAIPNESSKHPPRCFGYYFTEQEAYGAALGNYGGMDECLYNHLVIEKLAPGIHSSVDAEQVFWFEWVGGQRDKRDGFWAECKKPKGKRFDRVYAWMGIG